MYVLLSMIAVSLGAQSASNSSESLILNASGYFEKRGVNVLAFSNEFNGMFFDEKTAGIELIHHGVRTVTGGAVRFQNTPEQWDLVPKVIDRKVETEARRIEVTLRYETLQFDAKVAVVAKGKGVEIQVSLDKPLPAEWVGKAGFNLEFLPAAYLEKSYMANGKPGFFPHYPSGQMLVKPDSEKIAQFGGHNTFDHRGRNEFLVPTPLAVGNHFVLAPEDPERRVVIQSANSDLLLFDGRNLAQNGWFVVRSLFPANKTGTVLTWYLEPNAVSKWIREPVIGFSQVGYLPNQEKVAVIELDKNDTPLQSASLFRVGSDGSHKECFTGKVELWGNYLRYQYAKFPFSAVKEPGIYYIVYGGHRTNSFVIAPDVYSNIWHPTLDVWFPAQMDHMAVNEGYRMWHGVPFLDDCLQAPLNHEHFDGYRMGDTTDTKYKPLERIPGMAVGGWFDAGDFDIQTGSHNSVISSFVKTFEDFGVKRDMTFIDQKNRYVDMHRPDGVPDLLQQVEHGALNLVAQCENIGHPVRGIVVPALHQYHHLGDASTETDNLPYNRNLAPYETDGKSSGTPDDRWAFTTRSSSLDYQTAGALAAASRVLKGYNDNLSARSLASAIRLVKEADAATAQSGGNNSSAIGRRADSDALLQLYITTRERTYLDRVMQQISATLEPRTGATGGGQNFSGGRGLLTALKALPYADAAFKERLRAYVLGYKESLATLEKQNPYGVPITLGGWGGSGGVVNFAITNYYAYKAFPDIMKKEDVLKGVNYIFGCHPYSNVSFVNGVGAKTKKVAYGTNRADFATIAGGIVPGLILLKPDFLENKDDWPFLWGENEVTIGGSAEYLLLGNALNALVQEMLSAE